MKSNQSPIITLFTIILAGIAVFAIYISTKAIRGNNVNLSTDIDEDNCETILSGYKMNPITLSHGEYKFLSSKSLCNYEMLEEGTEFGYTTENRIFLSYKNDYLTKYFVDLNGVNNLPNEFGKDIFICFSHHNSSYKNYDTIKKTYDTCQIENQSAVPECLSKNLNADCKTQFFEEKIINF